MSVEEKISKIAYSWGLRVNGGFTVTTESKPSPKKNRSRELRRNGKKMKTADLLKRVKFLKILGFPNCMLQRFHDAWAPYSFP